MSDLPETSYSLTERVHDLDKQAFRKLAFRTRILRLRSSP